MLRSAGCRLFSAGLPGLQGSATTQLYGALSQLPAHLGNHGPCLPNHGPSASMAHAKAFTTSNPMGITAEDYSEMEGLEEGYNQSIIYPPPRAAVGSHAPAFKAPAVVDNEFQTVSLEQFKGQYVVLFFYPKDFTFVCPTEIIAFSDRAKEFAALNTQVIACSTDTEETHLAWIRTPRSKGGLGYMQIPILADTTKAISAQYGVLAPDAGVALRGLFIINPQGVIEQITINNMPIGRSVDETLRLLQAIQYVEKHGEVCPANWKPGAPTMVADPDKSLEYFANTEDTGSEAIAAKLQPITSRKDYDAITKSGSPVVIDFYAPWCGKCRQLGPFMDELVDKYPNVKFMKIDTRSSWRLVPRLSLCGNVTMCRNS
ncbi:thioredoxin-like protein [Dunaliella salina]|uniref:thioredoxin-dependent peroxiredoxin n=1 Tax=Dunaliella salina TaxID=3046 RepID=A0ABQ7H8F8_DUNSA|nr:thioredoxin-like protein [Dunaliella salina]|eukprot:KAF5843141.1 thioredoxin-like protein [Dunaliella salina]